MLLSRLLAQRQKGAVLVLSALAIPMLFATTGLAIDLGSAYLWHTSQQNAADAAALAGANALKNGDATSTVDRILLTSVTQNVKNDRDIARRPAAEGTVPFPQPLRLSVHRHLRERQGAVHRDGGGGRRL